MTHQTLCFQPKYNLNNETLSSAILLKTTATRVPMYTTVLSLFVSPSPDVQLGRERLPAPLCQRRRSKQAPKESQSPSPTKRILELSSCVAKLISAVTEIAAGIYVVTNTLGRSFLPAFFRGLISRRTPFLFHAATVRIPCCAIAHTTAPRAIRPCLTSISIASLRI